MGYLTNYNDYNDYNMIEYHNHCKLWFNKIIVSISYLPIVCF